MTSEPNIDIDVEVDKFFNDSSQPKENSPKINILFGGNGAGKTTIIHEKYSKGYVIINAEEIYRNLGIFDEFGETSKKYVNEVGSLVAKKQFWKDVISCWK